MSSALAGGTLKFPLELMLTSLDSLRHALDRASGTHTKSSPRKIIEEYDYQDYAIIAALYDDGVKGLINLASENGFVPKEAYITGCHFCYEARKFLKDIFSDAFTLLT